MKPIQRLKVASPSLGTGVNGGIWDSVWLVCITRLRWKICSSVELAWKPDFKKTRNNLLLFYQTQKAQLQQTSHRSPEWVFLLPPVQPLPQWRSQRGTCQTMWNHRLSGETLEWEITEVLSDSVAWLSVTEHRLFGNSEVFKVDQPIVRKKP